VEEKQVVDIAVTELGIGGDGESAMPSSPLNRLQAPV